MKNRLLALLLVTGMVLGQAVPVYAVNGVQQTGTVQKEELTKLLNEGTSNTETRYMYLEDYPIVWFALHDVHYWADDVQITIDDESVCKFQRISRTSDHYEARFQALKVGKTTATVSWKEDGTAYQKKMELVVKDKMPSDGVKITDLSISEWLMQYKSEKGWNYILGDDGYISADELKTVTGMSANDIQQLSDLKYVDNVEYLYIGGTFTDLNEIGGLTNLESLTLLSNENLTDISALGQMSALKKLNFIGCSSVTDISSIYNLAVQLKYVDLRGTQIPASQRIEFLKHKLQNALTLGEAINLERYGFENVSLENGNDVVQIMDIDDDKNLVAQKVGTADITLNLDGTVFNVSISVCGTSDTDLQLGEKVDTSVKAVVDETQKDKNLILTSTGDLLQTSPEVKKEKSDVKKYVGGWVYSGNDRFTKSFTLSMDDVLSSDGTNLAYDVKEFSGHYALTDQDVLIDTYNTGEKVMDNVKSWIEDDGYKTYVLKKDGTLWSRTEVEKGIKTNVFQKIADSVKKINSYSYLKEDNSKYYYDGTETDIWDADSDEFYYDADGNCIVGTNSDCNLGKADVKAVYNNPYSSDEGYYITNSGDLYLWERSNYYSKPTVRKIGSGAQEFITDWRQNDEVGSVLVLMADGKYYTYNEDSKKLESATWMGDLNLETFERTIFVNGVPVLDHVMYVENPDRFGYNTGSKGTIVRTDGTIWELRNGIPVKTGSLNGDNFSVDDNKHPNGLSDTGENGNWYYYKDGKIATDVTTVAQNASGWWYVKDGKVDFSYTGLAANEYGWWRIVNGAVDFNCTSVVNSEYGWWFVRNGQIDFGYTGLAANEYGWWRIVNGQVDFSCTSVVNSEYGWWFVRNGQIDFGYTGVAQNEYGWWRIVNGQLDFSCTSVVNSEYGWWYVENGQINFGYTGLAPNEYGWWYIRNGQLDFGYTGYAWYNGGYYAVVNGHVV